LKRLWFSVGGRIELHIGNAEMYVSGNTTRLALFRAACLIRLIAFEVVSFAERKMGET
jgi:hypothetical protein